MAFDLANLPTDIDALRQIILTQAAEAAAREAELAAAKAGLLAKALEIEKYKLQIARLRRMQFGRSSEKIARTIEQLELKLEELEAETPAARDDASVANSEQSSPAEASSPQERKQFERRALPAHLPCRDVVHEPSCTCRVCGGEMRKVGEDVTRILDYIPGHFEVVRHVRPAFSCRRCESMVQSPMPSLPIERGQAGPGLLAHILVGKYCDHLPLYRQSGIYAREGIELERTTMATWVGKVTALASPLVEAVAAHVMAAEKLHVDDTPVPVLGAWHGQDQDRTALGLPARRTPVRPPGAASGRLSLFSQPQGRTSARAARPFPRFYAGRRVFRLRAALRGCPRAACDRDRGRVLVARAALFLRYPCHDQRTDRRRGAAADWPVVRRRAHGHGIASRTATAGSSKRGTPHYRRSRSVP